MNSAYAELRDTGRLGPAGVALLYRTVRAVARTSNFPPPEGHSRWDDDAVQAAAHEFLSRERGPQRLASLVLTATDDASFGRLLTVAVRNALRDVARRTDRAALMRRLTEVLRDDDRLVQVPAKRPGEGRWALREHLERPLWQGRLSDLVAAAWSVRDVQVIRWRSARRRGPVSDGPSLAAVAVAVLRAADGPVDLPVFAEVFEHRFGLTTAPRLVSLDDEPAPHPALPRSDEIATTVEIREQAQQIWEQLSDRERQILAHHDAAVRDLAAVLGLGKSAAAEARHRLIETLRSVLSTDPAGEAVAEMLIAGAQQLEVHRTAGAGSSSIEDGVRDDQ